MGDVSSVVAPIAISTAISTFAEFRQTGAGGSMKVIFANTALFAGLTAIGQFIDWDLAAMLAILNLLYVMLNAGAPFIDWFARLVDGAGHTVSKGN